MLLMSISKSQPCKQNNQSNEFGRDPTFVWCRRNYENYETSAYEKDRSYRGNTDLLEIRFQLKGYEDL